jgi:hypothetical protein
LIIFSAVDFPIPGRVDNALASPSLIFTVPVLMPDSAYRILGDRRRTRPIIKRAIFFNDCIIISTPPFLINK